MLKKLKIILSIIILSSTLLVGKQAHAQVTATAQTTIDVNFPEILVLYTFSQITLNLDATYFTGQLGLGTTTACIAGEVCVDAGTTTITVDAASEDVDIANSGIPLDGALTDVDIDLLNAIGARSLGLTDANYTVAVADQNVSTALNLNGTPGAMANTGLLLSTTNLPLTIDVSAIGGVTTISEDFEITVSGT